MCGAIALSDVHALINLLTKSSTGNSFHRFRKVGGERSFSRDLHYIFSKCACLVIHIILLVQHTRINGKSKRVEPERQRNTDENESVENCRDLNFIKNYC